MLLDLKVLKTVPAFINGDRIVFNLIIGSLTDIILRYSIQDTNSMMTIGISGVDNQAYVLNIDVSFESETLTAEGVGDLQTGEARSAGAIQEIGLSNLLQ